MARKISASRGSADWRNSLQQFACRCADSAPEEQVYRIREAWALLCHADAVVWGSPSSWLREEDLDAMLAADACESAVMAMLGPDVGFMLSRGGGGICLATVVLPDSENEVTAEASTLALALLTAVAAALLDHTNLCTWLLINQRVQDQVRSN